MFSQHNFEVINENDAAGSIQKQNTINNTSKNKENRENCNEELNAKIIYENEDITKTDHKKENPNSNRRTKGELVSNHNNNNQHLQKISPTISTCSYSKSDRNLIFSPSSSNLLTESQVNNHHQTEDHKTIVISQSPETTIDQPLSPFIGYNINYATTNSSNSPLSKISDHIVTYTLNNRLLINEKSNIYASSNTDFSKFTKEFEKKNNYENNNNGKVTANMDGKTTDNRNGRGSFFDVDASIGLSE